jgi:6-phosphogluconolactonase
MTPALVAAAGNINSAADGDPVVTPSRRTQSFVIYVARRKDACILHTSPVLVCVNLYCGIAVVGFSKSLFARVALGCSLLFLGCQQTFAMKTEWAFVASPTKGIFSYKFDADKLEVTEAGRATDFAHASFIALHPSGSYLYAVGEGSGAKDSRVASFALDRQTGKLEKINEVASGGHGPCHISVNSSGQVAMVANYNSGSFAAFPIQSSGKLGVMSALVQDKGCSIKPRQKGPQAHCILFGPHSHWALGCDLGLDKVMIFQVNPSDATIVPHSQSSASLKPGAGPRHIALHPNNKFAYVINELDSTLTVFNWNWKDGTLKESQTVSTLPVGITNGITVTNYPAEVAVHPNGKFVFGSNRGHDSIVIFKIDEKTGTVTLVGHTPCGGNWPRHFDFDTTGKLLLVANEESAQTSIFRIDTDAGTLSATETAFAIERPMCVKCIDAK